MVHDATLSEYSIRRNHRAGQDLTSSADLGCGIDACAGINQRGGSQARSDHPSQDVDPVATTASPNSYQCMDVMNVATVGSPSLKPRVPDIQRDSG